MWRCGSLILSLLVLSTTSIFADDDYLTITSYELIQQQSLGKGTYNFIYQADVTNSGPVAALGVTATLAKVSRFVTIIDGELSFGDVPAGATVTSTDTFTVQQGRKGGPKNFPADPYDFEWEFTAEEGLIPVPDVVGLNQSDAASALTGAGLVVGDVTEIPSSTAPAGEVVGQTPPAGTEVEADSAVDLLVSSGPPVAEAYPQGSFAGTYQGLIPGDSTLPEYDLKRFGIITGLVEDDAGSPVSGVAVTILDHPEYGSALTDTDGRFYMPAHGGIELTVNYEAVGFVSAQRTVDVPWNEFVIAPTQVLTPLDTPSTLFFDGNPNTALVHVSSTLTDDLGSREATVIFSGDTQATAVYADGSQQVLPDTLTVRATQFGSDAALPGLLPPTSLFTYCAEFAIDEAGGAVEVQFSQPVAIYLPNFRNFDVGIRVPVGGYDRQAAAWMPMGDGVVAELLDTNTDDIIDALDADGDGLPDDLDGDSFYDDEVFGITASGQYAAGDTVWRTLVTHFTPLDDNWPGGPPLDAIPPNPPDGPSLAPPPCPTCWHEVDANTRAGGRSGGLNSGYRLGGSGGQRLHYGNRRTGDFSYRVRVPTSGAIVPASLKRIDVEFVVAGRVMKQTLPAAADQATEFVWNGRDALGMTVASPVTAHTRVGFVYDRVNYTTSSAIMAQTELEQSFAAFGDVIVDYGPEQTLWKVDALPIPVLHTAGKNAALGNGWTLSNHHALITGASSMLVRGDGTARITPEGQNLVWTVAGNGTYGFSGDGDQATDAQLNRPTDVAVAADGTLYIADYYNLRVRRVAPDGTITTVAGDGTGNSRNLNEGGLAIEASLPDLRTVEVGPDGAVYLVAGRYSQLDGTSTGDLVRRLEADGTITTVAGLNFLPGGGDCFVNDEPSIGDGGPAIDATLCDAQDILFGPDGSLYIAQGWAVSSSYEGPNVIRKVGPDGFIHTISGEGPDWITDASQRDSGTFTYDVRYNIPEGISLDAEGNLLVADNGHVCVRSLDADGRVRTIGGICGDGDWPGVPDGGIATSDVWQHNPRAVLAAPGGGYFAVREMAGNVFIVRIDAQGYLHAFANAQWEGTSTGYAGDGGPALDAQFQGGPGKITLGADGYIYYADYGNHAIRKIGPAMAANHPAVGPGEILVPERPDAGAFAGQGHIFDFGGKHLRTINLATGVVLYRFHYDAEHRLVAAEDRFGRMTTIQRDVDGKPDSITGPYGDVTQLSVDAAGNLTTITYADDTGYQLGYTGSLLTAMTDPRGNPFTYSYDSLGRFAGSSVPDGGGFSVTRTDTAGGGYETVLTSAEGRVVSYADRYDTSDRLNSEFSDWDGALIQYLGDKDSFGGQRLEANGMLFVTDDSPDPLTAAPFSALDQIGTPAGLIRTLTTVRSYGDDLDTNGLPDTETEFVGENGNVTTILHDLLASTWTSTSPMVRITAVTYDPVTLLDQVLTVQGLEPTNLAYDDHGRLTGLTEGTRQTLLAYDGPYLAGLTDALGQTTTYGRDLLGRLTTLTYPDGTQWTFGRDALGNLATVTEPDGLTEHVMTYTPHGDLASYQSPLGAAESLTYDTDRLLARRQYPSSLAIDWVYNTKGQLTAEQAPEGVHSYTYDPATGQLVQAVSRDGQQVDYTYDGALLTRTDWSGGVIDGVQYVYDDHLRASQMDYAGLSLPMTYDTDGLLTSVGSVVITRNPDNGLVTGVTDGDFQITYGYNGHGELGAMTASHAGTTVYEAVYTRDDLGRITIKVETIDGQAATWDYGYDLRDQLVSVERNDVQVEAYTYDAVGNRIGIANSLRGVFLDSDDFLYDADHKLLTAGGTTYSYDADGRLAQVDAPGSITGYAYNTDGTLSAVDLADGRQVTYPHDNQGRRIVRAVDGTATDFWLYGDGLLLLAEYDGAGALRAAYVYADSPAPVAMIHGGSRYHVVADHLGSPRLVLDASGNTVQRSDYDAFGNRVVDMGTGPGLPLGFAAGMADRDHELVRFGARDYQPSAGRWTARDPVLFEGGENLYEYVENDPLNSTDPTGLFRKRFRERDVLEGVGRGAQAQEGTSGPHLPCARHTPTPQEKYRYCVASRKYHLPFRIVNGNVIFDKDFDCESYLKN